MNDTEPLFARLSPAFLKISRMSPAVRVLLSVSASTMIAEPLGPYASYVTCS
jgi:hypothetical protein